MSTILTVVVIYFIISLGIGFWVARKEQNRADDYFLAGRKLPWYAVSLSMTGSNIGTEHFIGMVGTAWAFGLAPATYEWGNFIPYSILLWVFLPFFFRKKLYTIPEFLEQRYNHATRTSFAALTLFHMVLAVLVPALYAGGLILFKMGASATLTEFHWGFVACVGIISAVTAAYCIYGGLLSVVWTDVLQVTILVIGGLLLVVVGLQHEKVGGLSKVIEKNANTVVRPLGDGTTESKLAKDVPKEDKSNYYSRTSLLLPMDHPVSPWTGVATFWFTLSLWYVGTNQFYIQRCLGARSEWDAKMGVIGCGMLKLFLPVIIVFPGMIAFVAFANSTDSLTCDDVYVEMIKWFFAEGWFGLLAQGILLSALLAAIMSTVSSVLNSSSTIWSIDVYQRTINSSASEADLVSMGRWATFFIILLGTALAPLLIWFKDGIFIYIQGMAALFAPPIVIIFLAAFFWSRAHGRAAVFTLWFGILFGLFLWFFTSLPWMFQKIDFEDSNVQNRLAVILREELPDGSKLREQIDKHPVIEKRRKAVIETLAHDSAVQERLTKDSGVRLDLLNDQTIRQRRTTFLEEFIRDPAAKKTVDEILEGLPFDARVRQQLAESGAFRANILRDKEIRPKIAAHPAFLKQLFRDKEVRERIAANSRFRKLLAKDPVVMERLAKDSAALKQLADNDDLKKRLSGDADIRRRLAERRAGAWLPFLGEGIVAQVVFWIGQAKPLLNRAAITWVICLIAMVLSTFILRADPSDRYDPDAIWSFSWARLPAEERNLNRFPRNLMFWWLVMVTASGTLFVIFR